MENISQEKKVQVCIMTFNKFGKVDHYQAFVECGFHPDIARQLCKDLAVQRWRRELLNQGVLKVGDKQKDGEFAVEVAN